MAKKRSWDGKWSQVRTLGEGGQGYAILVNSDSDPNKKGVLKHLKSKKSKKARGRMFREMASLKTLSNICDSVPSVLDHNTEMYEDTDKELYLVMEYIEGRTLSKFIEEEGILSFELAKKLVLSLCNTIENGHKDGILHRDIKPDNIIIRNYTNEIVDVVVVDYGLSFNCEDESVTDLTSIDEGFRNNFIILPEAYLQNGNKHDKRSDVTAVCGIFYFALSGCSVGLLLDETKTKPHHRTGQALRDIIDHNGLCKQVELLFDKGFEQKPNDRYQTIDALKNSIELISIDKLENDFEDPIALAEKISRYIDENDRDTVVRSFIEPIQNTLVTLAQIIKNEYLDKLNKFKLIVRIDAAEYHQNLPSNYECPTNHALLISLNLDHIKGLKIIIYKIGLIELRCDFIRQEFIQEKEIKPVSEQKVLCFCDVKNNPELSEVLNDFELWLTKSIKEYYQHVIEANES